MTSLRNENSPGSALYAQVGELIKKNREAKRVSQERLAASVGLSRTSVTNIEGGRQKVLLHTLAAIAEALGVTVADLLPSRAGQKIPLDQKLPQNLRKTERQWINQIVDKSFKA